MFVLAQLAGYSVPHLAIMVVIVAAIVGLVYVALNQFGVAIPQWVQHVFWIIVVAFVVIAAIKLVASM